MFHTLKPTFTTALVPGEIVMRIHSPNMATLALALVLPSIALAEPGEALNLSNSQDWVELGSSMFPAGDSYTKEAWVNMGLTDCENIISSNKDPFWIFKKHLRAGHQGTYALVQDPQEFPENQWVHVAVTYSAEGGALRLYVDGTQRAEACGAKEPSGGPTAIGRHYGGSCWYKGIVDEVRIWDHARSAVQIADAFNAELAADDRVGLIGYFRMNQGEAGGDNTGEPHVIDDSGNGNHGAFIGIPLTGPTSNFIAPGGVGTGIAVVATDTVLCDGEPEPVVDEDGDGVLDDDDVCDFTAESDPAAGVPGRSLGRNRWADLDGDGNFETNGNNPTRRSFTIEETGGCSCAQIIETCGYGGGHTEFGCSNGVMDIWTGKHDQAGGEQFLCDD
jgi:hypothetical protein